MTPAQQHAPTWIGMPDTYPCPCLTDPTLTQAHADDPNLAAPAASADPGALVGAAQTAALVRVEEHDSLAIYDAWQCHGGHTFRVRRDHQPLTCPICNADRKWDASQSALAEEAEAPPSPADNYRTLEALIRAVITARALVTQATPYDDALLALARAHRRDSLIGPSTDQAIANTYADAPVAFLADLDQMTPAQQARVSLRVARAWGLDVSQVDQLWVDSREKIAQLGMLA